MPYTTLISVAELTRHYADPDWAVVDCRFSLDATERGRSDYKQAHIPGAVYAHLDEDLSGAIIPGKTGRHPLPAVASLAQTLSAWGIDGSVQVVAYDDMGGAVAVRLWWMLRWLGHAAVALLDGGWQQWQSAAHPTASGVETRAARAFTPRARPELALSTAEVQERLKRSDFLLFDARSAERYRGENEPIDPVAGHIPGAVSAPYDDNLAPDGRFRAPDELRAHYEALLDGKPPENTAFYCGSGVTAVHNMLAMVHAGMGEARLYAGSWSEWIADPERPVAVGEGIGD